MKKNLVLLLSLVLLFGVACSGGKYGDLKIFFEDVIKISDNFTKALNNATSENDVVIAINKYKMDINSLNLAQRSRDFEKKYPELKTAKEPPKELIKHEEKLFLSLKKMELTMKKIKSMFPNSKIIEKAIHSPKN